MLRFLSFIVLYVSLISTNSQATSIFFQQQDSIVTIGDSFNIDLRANITDPILGWGLDVGLDSSIIDLTGVLISPQWFPGFSLDGDGLVGLAFPLPISGNNVLLATLSFQAIDVGLSALSASFTLGDLTEGFALSTGGFDTITFSSGSVQSNAMVVTPPPALPTYPVPAPAPFWLMASGLGLFFKKRRYSKLLELIPVASQ